MSHASVRVLYVDDDVALVRLVQKTLGRRGFEVTTVAPGEDVIARIAAAPVNVIALDHHLASGTGLEVLSRLAAIPDAPPVVYVTGSTDWSVAVAALKAGATDFVPKTVGDDFLILLASALEQAVAKARLWAQKEAAEQEVRAARDRAELLLSEVNHRVANSLALVSSLVRLQANGISDQAARDALGETQARIVAISLVHKWLYSSGDVKLVALDEYLTGLLDNLKSSMQSFGPGTSLRYDLAPVKLPTDASINLGVVVTEWVTNAYKYAYPGREGEVRVRLAPLPDERVELTVADDGIGRSDNPARGTGLGTRIVKAMAASMGAEVEYLDGRPGTIARLIFSAPAEQG